MVQNGNVVLQTDNMFLSYSVRTNPQLVHQVLMSQGRPSSVHNISPRTTTIYWYCGFLRLKRLRKTWKQNMVPFALAPATLATLLAYMCARLSINGAGTGYGHLRLVTAPSLNLE
jgi:hypothetical protein